MANRPDSDGIRGSGPIRQVADASAVVCDAIYELVVHDDYTAAARRFEEVADNLSVEPRRNVPETSDSDGIAACLRALKHLSRAMEALASDAVDRGEVEIDSAVTALQTAAKLLQASYEGAGQTEPRESPVQMSVAEAVRVPNAEAINDALRNLLNRTEPDAFVILVDAHTGNFIQFLGSKEGPLVLDLPYSGLSDDETDRAGHFFESKGLIDARTEESFSVSLGRDSDRATQLALGVFGEVYESKPDFSLKIEEN